MNIEPNTFIIGVQKSGTTSLNSWLCLHPEVFGSEKLKDINFFLRPDLLNQMLTTLSAEHSIKHKKHINENKRESVVLLSAVNYCYYPDAISKIASLYPNAKLIIILRNPVERAISAYRYFHKTATEKRSITEAFDYDWLPTDNKFIFSQENNDFTYIEHGLYAIQIKMIYKYFPKNQLLIIDFDEMEQQPKQMLGKVYTFLNISNDFFPSFEAKNVTGKSKLFFLSKMVESKNPVKKWFVKYFIKSWLSYSNRRGLAWKLREWNTKKGGKSNFNKDEELVKEKLRLIYKDEITELDKMLNSNYLYKWNLDKSH